MAFKRLLPILLLICLWGGTSHAADGDHFGEYEYWDNYDGWMYGYYYWMNGRILWWDDAFYYSPGHAICIYDPDNEIDQTNNHTDALQDHDQDGDGISDWDEIQAESDPTDPEDIPGDDPPEPRGPDDPYLPNDPVQDNDADGEANLTDPDDDNDNHADADGDPDADGRNGPDDIEQLIKDTVENLGDAKLDDTVFLTDDDGNAIYDENGHAKRFEIFAWEEFIGEYQKDNRQPVNPWYTYADRLGEEGRSGGEEDKLTWRLCCTVEPDGGKVYYWQFFNPDVCDGKWMNADRFGVMPRNLPFLPQDPGNLTTTNSIGIILDPDGDGMSSGRETINGSDSMNGTVTFNFGTDSDGDSWADSEEQHYGSNLHDNQSHPTDDGDYWDTVLSLQGDANGDYDGDGHSNADESASGTSPTNHYDAPRDSDGDGRSDYVEQSYGSNPHDAGSRPPSTWHPSPTTHYDNDGDGFSNQIEQLNGSDPYDGSSTPSGQTSDMEGEGPGTEGEDQTDDIDAEQELGGLSDDADAVRQCINALGLNLSFLDSFEAQDFSATVEIPIGGTLSNLEWYSYTFQLNPEQMAEGVAKTVLLSVRGVLHSLCMIMISLKFFSETWKMLWTL
jgi:hypothetical protein